MTYKSIYFYDRLVYFLFFIKIIYYITILCILGLTNYNKTHSSLNISKIISFLEYWNQVCHFIFYILISLMLIYIFNPFKDKTYLIDNTVRFLFFILGIIYLFNVNWTLFFKSKIIDEIQYYFADFGTKAIYHF